jgi:hypothetical protein
MPLEPFRAMNFVQTCVKVFHHILAIPADDLLAGLELATVRVLDDFSKRKLKGNTRQTFEDSVKATLQYWPGDIAEETEPRHMTDDTAKGTSGGGESSPGGALHL